MRGGFGSLTIEGTLDGGEGWDFGEIAGVAVGDVVASEIEVVAGGGADVLN